MRAGASHGVAIKAAGTLWTWGRNNSGQLGDQTLTNRTAPTAITVTNPANTAKNWVAVSAGSGHTAAIRSDGTLWTWGLNNQGQLGLGSTTNASLPTRITGTGWAAVECGESHTIALKGDGTLWAWGLNSSGQLGIGNTTRQLSPIKVGTLNTWTQISVGPNGFHSFARFGNGYPYAWGLNSTGQLGDGATSNRTSPFNMYSGPVRQVAAGGSHSAVIAVGLVYAFGKNDKGQLGLGYESDYSPSFIWMTTIQ